MTYALYNAAATVAAPFGAAWLALNARHKPLLARFAPQAPVCPVRPVWMHACSVGEINTARPVAAAIHARWPELPIVMTVSTIAGYHLADSSGAAYSLAWCPFDHARIVRKFIRELDPRALLLVETEIWPNIVRECRRHDTPVALINGRLSDKHYPRYLRWRKWLAPVFQQLSMACVQNIEYADRFASLGTDHSALRVTGNVKFDTVNTDIDPELSDKLRKQSGINPGEPVLVFGSLRAGDDTLLAKCWQTLREENPALRLIVAPRHIDRLPEILAHFHEPVLLRSECNAGKAPNRERILALDTLGELRSFYAIADVAVIGGSFYPGVNGHNPLESAALGVPTVFGPFMRNFIDPATELVKCGGARQVTSPDGLLSELQALLRSPETRASIATQGKDAVARNRGAIERTLQYLAPFFEGVSAPTDRQGG